MFKLITQEHKIIIKSYNIYQLWRFILSNPDDVYQFLIDYIPISNDEFLKCFLNETENYQDYLRMYRVLKPTKSIFNYAKISKI
jgi:hypothetical protein